MKNIKKKILCLFKGHIPEVKTYDDWSDDKGLFMAGICVRCTRCKEYIWSAPIGYIKKILYL